MAETLPTPAKQELTEEQKREITEKMEERMKAGATEAELQQYRKDLAVEYNCSWQRIAALYSWIGMRARNVLNGHPVKAKEVAVFPPPIACEEREPKITAIDALAVMGLEWFEAERVQEVSEKLLAAEVNDHTPFQALQEVADEFDRAPNVSRPLANSRSRILLATTRSLTRRSGIDWYHLIATQELKAIFQAFQVAAVPWEHAEHIRSTIGTPALRAIQNRFGSMENFRKFSEQAKKEQRMERKLEQTQHVGKKAEEIYKKLAGVEWCAEQSKFNKREAMRELFRSEGLPGDWYRNDAWHLTLWRVQSQRVRPLIKAAKIAVSRIYPFSEHPLLFSTWMDGFEFPRKSWKFSSRMSSVEFGMEKLRTKSEEIRNIIHGNESPDMLFEPRIFSKIADTNTRNFLTRIFQQYPHIGLNSADYKKLFPFSSNTIIADPWARLCSSLEKSRLNEADKDLIDNPVVLDHLSRLASIFQKNDGLTWCERINWCDNPDDFRKLFSVLKIPHSDQVTYDEPADDCKSGIDDLTYAIELRFGTYENFIAWMEGKADERTTMVQAVRAIRSITSLRDYMRSVGIAGDQWKSESWMRSRSKLPVEQGGIGRDCSGIADALEKHPYLQDFGVGKVQSYRIFVNAVDPEVTNVDQAWDVVCGYAEYFGMSLDELLRMSNEEMFERHERLHLALEHLER